MSYPPHTTSPPPRRGRALVALLALVGLLVAASGCTIIKYVDPPDEDPPDPPPPKVVDMVVLVDLSRSAANLNESYHQVLGQLFAALGEKNISVRRAAMAPLYRRIGGAVPLLYGDKDPNSQFSGFGEAIAYYTFDDGAMFLQEEVDADGENLATLGLDLDERTIYRPESAEEDGSPYFGEAADGFLVVTLSASERRCAADAEDCRLDMRAPGSYFTATRSGGDAEWLLLPGPTGLPPSKIIHIPVVTAEGVDFTTFEKQCTGQAGFPAAKLDVMEPSDKTYFGPVVDGIRDGGGRAHKVDLCEAMSIQGTPRFLEIAGKINSALN
jgi:hypothetical protein